VPDAIIEQKFADLSKKEKKNGGKNSKQIFFSKKKF